MSSIDDFQISVPNPNQLPPTKDFGWTVSQDKLFVRVNISPGPSNDATLYVSFTKPYFPEYVFYNQTDFAIQVQHKS